MDTRIPTKGSQLKRDANFQVVVFNPSKRQNNKSKRPLLSQPDDSNASEFDIKKATKEIIKLGAKGFYKWRRDQTLKSLAIELGAKPEKSRFHNYKDLKKIRNKRKERREQRLELLKSSSNLSAVNQYRKKYAQKVKKKKEMDITSNFGKTSKRTRSNAS